ncbi:hypothetical protein [Saccharothrix sp. ALI-22-I]|uniref:hypothetical protein n=1 Tax=Saccharothrix sp. ALI-22-I TaxID=1933778 RepID=UPI00117A4FD3|nr:hypothetical protein [Saccharothrix sp. ALI-22-I]
MIRTRFIAAVLVAGTLTAVVAGSTAPALASPTTAAAEDTVKPVKVKPGDPGEQKPGEPAKQKPGEPGKQKPGEGRDVPEEAVKALAVELGISVERSRQVFRDLRRVEARGDAITADPAFVAIAEGLGLTPEELLTVLREVKEAVGGIQKPKPDPAAGTNPDERTASGSPTK